MWIYDGEEWVEEGSEKPQEPELQHPRYDRTMPELQVVEIIQVPKSVPVPPLRLPLDH